MFPYVCSVQPLLNGKTRLFNEFKSRLWNFCTALIFQWKRIYHGTYKRHLKNYILSCNCGKYGTISTFHYSNRENLFVVEQKLWGINGNLYFCGHISHTRIVWISWRSEWSESFSSISTCYSVATSETDTSNYWIQWINKQLHQLYLEAANVLMIKR